MPVDSNFSGFVIICLEFDLNHLILTEIPVQFYQELLSDGLHSVCERD